jgi:hypothetical protein
MFYLTKFTVLQESSDLSNLHHGLRKARGRSTELLARFEQCMMKLIDDLSPKFGEKANLC